MSQATKDKVEGAAHQVKGAVKDNVGHAIGNPRMEAEGKAERVEGKVQGKVGDAEAYVNRNAK